MRLLRFAPFLFLAPLGLLLGDQFDVQTQYSNYFGRDLHFYLVCRTHGDTGRVEYWAKVATYPAPLAEPDRYISKICVSAGRDRICHEHTQMVYVDHRADITPLCYADLAKLTEVCKAAGVNCGSEADRENYRQQLCQAKACGASAEFFNNDGQPPVRLTVTAKSQAF